MTRRIWTRLAVIVGFVVVTANAFAQAPAGRAGAPPQGPAGARQGAPAAGRGAAEVATRPALLFKEEWKQPPFTGELNDANRRVTQAAVASPNLEIKLYGSQVREVGVYNHEGRFDLWTGMANSPVAILLRDKTSNIDLTGLARLRAIVRTANLHVVHPALKLADGTLIAGSQSINTEGEFLSVEVAFNNQRWYKLDPEKVVTTTEVKTPDLSKVEEVGFVDLAPSGGHGSAGYANISTFELFAKTAPRTAGTR
jgi:hypothetical protein